MRDSFVEKLAFVVATVLWVPACEFDFPKRPATGRLEHVASREIGRAILNRKGFDYNKETL